MSTKTVEPGPEPLASGTKLEPGSTTPPSDDDQATTVDAPQSGDLDEHGIPYL